ncbi:MAG: NAD(P)/FAD-dependent oxidoreductase [Anaerovoracaceae bacterium]
MYRIHQIILRPGESADCLPEKILKKLGSSGRELLISQYKIVKESIDARDKTDIKLVYSVDFTVASAANPQKQVTLKLKNRQDLEIAPDMNYKQAVTMTGAPHMTQRPVIVGFGPAGMFAGLILARAGYRPLILERGQDVDARTASVERFWKTGLLDTESNVQFGEGGAGTFSDGKLTTGIKDPRIRKVLEELVSAGGPEEILYKQKPHIGTDILRTVVKSIREEIKSLGGEIRFGCRVEDIVVEGDATEYCSQGREGGSEVHKCRITGVIIKSGDRSEDEHIPCEAAVFAVGHSARDTFRWLHEKGIDMAQKPFSIGVRIEHPQDMVDIAQYGASAAELGLPPADYKLSYRCKNGRGVYTFCMCPGGEVVVASSQEAGVVTNGMSYHDRGSGTANSALLCDVRVSDFGSDHALAGVEFQEKYERLAFENGGGGYKAPKCRWYQFRYPHSYELTEEDKAEAERVEKSLPDFAAAAIREAMPHLGKKLRGFDNDDAVMTAVEARSSSPVRFARNGSMTGSLEGTLLEGFYPCGEGAGYAGGIMSAAVDGIKAAETIIKKWKPYSDH